MKTFWQWLAFVVVAGAFLYLTFRVERGYDE